VIGKFEELALLALVRAGPDAYAAQVYKELEKNMQKAPQFSALYTTLDRMAKKGMVKESSSTDDKNRRLFTISGAGRQALNESLGATQALGGFLVPGPVGA